MSFLYHGSSIPNLKVLEPRKRYTPAKEIEFEAVYASPNPAFAAAHSFAWSSNEGIDLDIQDGKIKLLVPAALKSRSGIPVSIYKVDSQNFEHTKEESTGYTWHAKVRVAVLCEVQYPSVEAAVKASGGAVSYK